MELSSEEIGSANRGCLANLASPEMKDDKVQDGKPYNKRSLIQLATDYSEGALAASNGIEQLAAPRRKITSEIEIHLTTLESMNSIN